MKTWNTPEIEELNIAETANGFIPSLWEGNIINDSVLDLIPTKPSEGGSTNKGDSVNQLS